MTVTILSREVIPPDFFGLGAMWIFHISAADASNIVANHTTLTITTSAGAKLASNPTPPPYSGIYPTATLDPYNVAWTVAENGIGSGDWTLHFIVPYGTSTIFDNINNWTNFTVTATVPPVVVSQANFTAYPQLLTPAYNPVTFQFASSYSTQPGYRYLVNVYKYDSTGATSDTISKFKVTPQIDGTGYVDISRQLTNFLTVDYDPITASSIPDASNSYIKYGVGIGEELQTVWNFNSYTQYGVTGPIQNNVLLRQTPSLITNTFTVGDQINIISTDPFISGLHTVMAVPSPFTVVIDLTYNGTLVNTGGSILYADGRKTSYPDVHVISGLYAFNGARSWVDLPDWDWSRWFCEYASGTTPQPQLLSSLRNGSETYLKEEDHFYMTLDQSIYLNLAIDDPNHDFTVNWEARDADGNTLDNGIYSINPFAEPAGNIMQFKFCPGDLVGGSAFLDQIESVTFDVMDGTGSTDAIIRTYRVYLDKRCVIEPTEIHFMDRMGSILSVACQLRSKESGTIKREEFKQNIFYNEQNTYGSIYNQYDRGSKVTSVNVEKEIELNTNWMNNEMSMLFEEMLSSPYTWIKQVIPATNELPERTTYLACIVKETSFQVEYQKNKRLIRKTFTVKLANENIINI